MSKGVEKEPDRKDARETDNSLVERHVGKNFTHHDTPPSHL